MNEKLKQLSEHHPEICRRIGDVYCIGEYEFEFSGSGYLTASLVHIACLGQPALAWLADALKAGCEKRGWRYTIQYGLHGHTVALLTKYPHYGKIADTEAEALLDALLEVNS